MTLFETVAHLFESLRAYQVKNLANAVVSAFARFFLFSTGRDEVAKIGILSISRPGTFLKSAAVSYFLYY